MLGIFGNDVLLLFCHVQYDPWNENFSQENHHRGGGSSHRPMKTFRKFSSGGHIFFIKITFHMELARLTTSCVGSLVQWRLPWVRCNHRQKQRALIIIAIEDVEEDKRNNILALIVVGCAGGFTRW